MDVDTRRAFDPLVAHVSTLYPSTNQKPLRILKHYPPQNVIDDCARRALHHPRIIPQGNKNKKTHASAMDTWVYKIISD